MKKAKIIIVLILGFFFISHSFAKRGAPQDIPPVVHKGVKYLAPHWGDFKNRLQNGGYIEAWDVNTNRFLWRLRIYTTEYNKNLEGDVQDIFITRMEIKDGMLVIWNEAKDKFIVDLNNMEVKPKNKIYKRKTNNILGKRPPPQECAAGPCCGDPPRPCADWLDEQRKKAGAIVIEQVPSAACTVFVDGEEWPEGRTYLAWKFVSPGKHSIECRSSDGIIFNRMLEVEIGRDTPVLWGP